MFDIRLSVIKQGCRKTMITRKPMLSIMDFNLQLPSPVADITISTLLGRKR